MVHKKIKLGSAPYGHNCGGKGHAGDRIEGRKLGEDEVDGGEYEYGMSKLESLAIIANNQLMKLLEGLASSNEVNYVQSG